MFNICYQDLPTVSENFGIDPLGLKRRNDKMFLQVNFMEDFICFVNPVYKTEKKIIFKLKGNFELIKLLLKVIWVENKITDIVIFLQELADFRINGKSVIESMVSFEKSSTPTKVVCAFDLWTSKLNPELLDAKKYAVAWLEVAVELGHEKAYQGVNPELHLQQVQPPAPAPTPETIPEVQPPLFTPVTVTSTTNIPEEVLSLMKEKLEEQPPVQEQTQTEESVSDPQPETVEDAVEKPKTMPTKEEILKRLQTELSKAFENALGDIIPKEEMEGFKAGLMKGLVEGFEKETLNCEAEASTLMEDLSSAQKVDESWKVMPALEVVLEVRQLPTAFIRDLKENLESFPEASLEERAIMLTSMKPAHKAAVEYTASLFKDGLLYQDMMKALEEAFIPLHNLDLFMEKYNLPVNKGLTISKAAEVIQQETLVI